MENTITITRKFSVEQVTEVVVPLYFQHLQNYYMVLSPSIYLVVKDLGKKHLNDVGLYPVIAQEEISNYILGKMNEVTPITEEKFKQMFTKVSLELEALMN